MTTPLHHVVLFRFRDGTPEAEIERCTGLLRGLGRLPGVLEWRVEPSLDTRKGRVVAEVGVFESREAFERWRSGDEHRAVAAELGACADWWVADFLG